MRLIRACIIAVISFMIISMAETSLMRFLDDGEVTVTELEHLYRRFALDEDNSIDAEYLQDMYDTLYEEGNNLEDIDEGSNGFSRRSLSWEESSEAKMLMNLKPLLPDHPHIMYWRPQKVGSSTILSILVSFAYRYVLLYHANGLPTFVTVVLTT